MLSRAGKLKRVKHHVVISFLPQCRIKYEQLEVRKTVTQGTFSNKDPQTQDQGEASEALGTAFGGGSPWRSSLYFVSRYVTCLTLVLALPHEHGNKYKTLVFKTCAWVKGLCGNKITWTFINWQEGEQKESSDTHGRTWGREWAGSPLAWSWLRAPGRWAYSTTEKAAAAGSVAYTTSDTVPVAKERICMGRKSY